MQALSYIDKIFYINLESRPDRRKQVEDQLKAAGIPEDKIERISAVHQPYVGIGCSQSQIQALELAIDRNYQHVIVIEDDIQIRDPNNFLSQLRQVFIDQIKYKLIFLGASKEGLEVRPHNDYLGRIVKGRGGVGYLVYGSFLPRLLGAFKDSLVRLRMTHQHWLYAIDQYMMNLYDSQTLIFQPTLIYQGQSYSDLAHQEVKYETA